MQVIIDEIINHIRAVDGEVMPSPAVMRRIVQASVHAVMEALKHDKRAEEERSTEGPYGLRSGRGR